MRPIVAAPCHLQTLRARTVRMQISCTTRDEGWLTRQSIRMEVRQLEYYIIEIEKRADSLDDFERKLTDAWTYCESISESIEYILYFRFVKKTYMSIV